MIKSAKEDMLYMSVNRRNECFEVEDNMTSVGKFVKRILDIVCSFLGLVLLSPIFLITYLALKWQGEGSVIFKQERIGYQGKPFYMYKFRTMHVNAENDGPQLAIKNDVRLTRIGKFLREHHLDQLPQFWNVFIGDMSMVGYRPERQYFIDQIMAEDSRYKCLFQIKPGVTSEATLYNGYTNTMEKMLERLNMDLRYLETATVAKDIMIIFKTFRVIILGDKSN